jgi:two-component system LytT family response regulator
MSSLRAIVVDDEAGCIQNLTYHIVKYCPDIQVIATAENAATATALLRDKTINIAFLDVELFDENIFSVLKATLDRACDIVFVTAHERYAVEAFRVSALDYLVKPLNKYEVIRCYEKIQQRHNVIKDPIPLPPVKNRSAGAAKIILRQGKEVYVIALSDIIFLEANGFYTTVHFFINGVYNAVLVSKSIKELHHEYQHDSLMRVHRSFVVNIGQVAAIKRMSNSLSLLMNNAATVSVAKRRVHSFLEYYTHNT